MENRGVVMVSWVVLAVSVLVLSVLVGRALRRANRVIERCLADLPPPAPTGSDPARLVRETRQPAGGV